VGQALVNDYPLQRQFHYYVSVDNAKVIKTDIVTDNGVIPVIDTVVTPK
jgi:uncharacterized surface protein with fasciclin (FAS1) repeats